MREMELTKCGLTRDGGDESDGSDGGPSFLAYITYITSITSITFITCITISATQRISCLHHFHHLHHAQRNHCAADARRPIIRTLGIVRSVLRYACRVSARSMRRVISSRGCTPLAA